MKRLLLAAASFIFCQQIFAQVAISNPASSPDPSAMLDVKSATKGFLMPRVILRTNVASPATGLMVYETTSNAVWVYNGTAWAQLGSGGGGASQWLVNGNHIYSGNTGNVGIGTTAPVSRLHLAGDMLMDGTNPIVQLQQSGVDKGFIQLSGDNLRMGTNSSNNSGRLVMRMNGSDRITVDSTGNMQIVGSQDAELNTHGYLMLGTANGTNLIFDNNEMMARNNGAPADLVMQNDGGSVGIGVASPVERVEVAGSMKLKGSATFLKMEVSQAGGGGPIFSQRQSSGIQFLRDGTTSSLGRMEYVDTANVANFLRFYAGSTISNTLTVTTDDYVGVGTSNPQARLQVVGAGEIFRLHSG
ncbi:MAG TPA: hypothetical protein VER36_07070, partial [Flavisolibacter sp.]|nr:hypothetical protein [Flavisolibacter sp.]